MVLFVLVSLKIQSITKSIKKEINWMDPATMQHETLVQYVSNSFLGSTVMVGSQKERKFGSPFAFSNAQEKRNKKTICLDTPTYIHS